MASNYPGNATAVQAPATAPAVNNAVVIVIPAGTDAPTIESITQALKVSADNHTFELQILGGTRTAKALLVDSTGGVSASQTPGTVQAPTIIGTAATALRAMGGHVVATGTAPAVAAGAAAGTGPTVAIIGSDVCGVLAITTGTSTSTGTLATITFSVPFDNIGTGSTFVFLSPASNANAAALSGSSQVRPGIQGLASWSLSTGSAALAASTVYQWNYLVVGA